MTARPPERDDLDALVDPLLQFAEEQLSKRGEFYPFGNVMTSDGEIELVAGATESDHPASQEVIDLLTEAMRARAAAGAIKAAGICYDVRIRTDDGSTTDAIAVALDHRAGDSVIVLKPYAKRRFRGIQFSRHFARPGDRRIFGEA